MRWFCRIAGCDYGPYSDQELRTFAREGRLSPLDFVREGTGAWKPASELGWLSFHAPPLSPAVNAPPINPVRSVRGAPAVWPWVLVGMAAFAAVCVGGLVILVIAGAAGDGQDSPTAVPPVYVGSHGESLSAAQTARLRVAGRDATGELQAFVETLSGEQKALLGLAALATGDDIYAAEITISNTGASPVRVYPQNITIHYGREAATITTSDHPRFLQACILQPGEYTQGLVMYEARIDIGAAMRLGGGGLAYNDPTIEVEYGD